MVKLPPVSLALHEAILSPLGQHTHKAKFGRLGPRNSALGGRLVRDN